MYNMNPLRGRPGKISPLLIKKTILKYKDVITQQNKIVSKTHEIWNVIAKELENKVTNNNLYVFTMCNRYAIKEEIFNKEWRNDEIVSVNLSLLSDSSSEWNENSENCSDSTYNEKLFIINLLREDFKNLLTEKVYKRRGNKQGKKSFHFLRS